MGGTESQLYVCRGCLKGEQKFEHNMMLCDECLLERASIRNGTHSNVYKDVELIVEYAIVHRQVYASLNHIKFKVPEFNRFKTFKLSKEIKVHDILDDLSIDLDNIFLVLFYRHPRVCVLQHESNSIEHSYNTTPKIVRAFIRHKVDDPRRCM